MDATLKAKWVEALRSGEYQQTFGVFENSPDAFLYRPNEPIGFCCLGVLCKVAGVPAQTEEGSNWSFVKGHIGLHESVLIDLNDTHEAPFSDIANYIEANL